MSGRAGQTTLVSTVPAGGNGAFGASFAGASTDGTRVFFETDEPLLGADTDAQFDVYERSAGQTTLLSTGPAGGNGAFGAAISGNSADGARVFFETDESLVSADTDTQQDAYERSGGQTTLLSTGPAGGNGALDAFVTGASADGARVFVGTEESLVSADTDAETDIYVRRIVVAPANAAPPAISGTATVGQTLSCSQGSWTNEPTSFAYRWNRDGTAIAAAPSSSYTRHQRRRRTPAHLHGDRLQRWRRQRRHERARHAHRRARRPAPRCVRQHQDRQRAS